MQYDDIVTTTTYVLEKILRKLIFETDFNVYLIVLVFSLKKVIMKFFKNFLILIIL